MRPYLLMLFSLVFIYSLSANPIDEHDATRVAQNFCQNNFPQSSFKSSGSINLVYKCISEKSNNLKSTNDNAFYFVFNYENIGFVIVSGDDAVYPILGYSAEGNFNPNNIPAVVVDWLEGYKKQIEYIRNGNIVQTKTVSAEWKRITNGQPKLKSSSSVAPLIKTKWGQYPYVNALCPYDNDSSKYTVTGCVATAMAQIMNFYEYPKHGFGFHSYNHNKYGTLSANFGRTYYNWTAMPDSLTIVNSEVATIMYHCGISVEMDYGVSGSGAYVISNKSPNVYCAEYAYKTYFGYSTDIKGLERKDFSDDEWTALLKNELNAGRPIQYAGYGQGGHTFACDGYDANGFFHMNWGWRGKYDGYFMIDALSPVYTGINSGPYTFNSNQVALIGIKPDVSLNTNDLELCQSITSNTDTIKYGMGFTIYTNIRNNGDSTFKGDYCAAVFDQNGVFVDKVEIKTGIALEANSSYSDTLKFSTTGILTLLPGKYQIFIYYRTQNSNWIGIHAESNNTISDSTAITVINTKDIQLFSSITVNPETEIYGDKSLTVWTDIVNFSATAFTGSFKAALYTTEGKFVSNIQQKTGMTLPSNSHYTNGLTFYTSMLNVNPGTYLLAVSHKYDTGNYQLTGSSSDYVNPIELVVKESPLKADIYENNNLQRTAYNLTGSFTNNSDTLVTSGSSIHISNDEDYYKIELEAGYSYTILARLQDVFSNISRNYTLDAMMQYSVGGRFWSGSYDEITEEIKVDGAKTLYFWVGPYFTGKTGSYELEITIKRLPVQIIEDVEEQTCLAQVFPNPVRDLLFIKTGNQGNNRERVSLMDLTGKVIIDKEYENSGLISIPVSSFEEGIYLLIIMDTNGNRVVKKVLIRR